MRDAYRIMERFAEAYLARGDAPVSEFLRTYSSSTSGGRTTDPAAIEDFLQAAARVLDAPASGI
ncbi:hypothetical protein ACI2IY_14025 [Lysobacter enzymogenes]|uniref:hypothetical protein n=1 Tax=Lysobacter enzymogenes TaxID=69 RepID=UPI00384C057C